MAIDRAKLTKSAQKHLAKGNLDRAIADYQRLAEDDPTDARTLLKLGDVYAKQGALAEASATYRKVAAQYSEHGFFLKAVAVFKQMLKLDPGQLDVWERLAEMYALLSLTSDAIATYEQVADAYVRNGKQYKALGPLGRLEELDPENVAACVRYAEALSKARRVDDAVEAFQRGVDTLKRQGRMEDYLKVAERLLFHQQDNHELGRDLAQLYLERGEPKRALARLQVCFKADPKNVQTLELLAKAFEKLGQIAKTISVYREVGRILEAQEDSTGQADAMRAILRLDSGDAEAQNTLDALEGTEEIESSVPMIELDDEDGDEELIILDDEEDSGVVSLSDSGPRSLPDAQDEAQVAAQVGRLMTEYDVFVRYGLEEKIEAQLNTVLALMPSHLDARVKLAEYYANVGDGPAASEHLLIAAHGVREQDLDLALEYCTLAVQHDPASSAAKQTLQAYAAPPMPHGVGTDDEQELDLLDEEIEEDFEEDSQSVPFVNDDVVTDSSRAGEVESGPELDTDHELYLDEADVTNELPEMAAGEDADIALAAEEPRPVAPLATDHGGSHNTKVQESRPPTDVASSGVSPGFAGIAGGSVTAADGQDSSEDIPEELQEALEEIDFYMAQGMQDEARDTYEDIAATYPGHSALVAKAVRVGLAEGPAEPTEQTAEPTPTTPAPPAPHVALAAPTVPPQAPSPAMTASHEAALAEMPDEPTREVLAPPAPAITGAFQTPSVPPDPGDHSFALAEKLASEGAPETRSPGAEAVEVGDVISQFKAGVRAAVDQEDTATHYDLGIAYMEMGLHSEAIEEFNLCLEHSERRCQALTMIGLSHVAKGEMEPALKHFSDALSSQPSESEQLELRFEMGNAYELVGKANDALIQYEQVEEVDPNYRDVAQRIERLGIPQSPAEEEDEFDTMFDNMILKD